MLDTQQDARHRSQMYQKIKNDEHNGTDYETDKIKKQDKSYDLSCLVAEAGLEPATSGL